MIPNTLVHDILTNISTHQKLVKSALIMWLICVHRSYLEMVSKNICDLAWISEKNDHACTLQTRWHVLTFCAFCVIFRNGHDGLLLVSLVVLHCVCICLPWSMVRSSHWAELGSWMVLIHRQWDLPGKHHSCCSLTFYDNVRTSKHYQPLIQSCGWCEVCLCVLIMARKIGCGDWSECVEIMWGFTGVNVFVLMIKHQFWPPVIVVIVSNIADMIHMSTGISFRIVYFDHGARKYKHCFHTHAVKLQNCVQCSPGCCDQLLPFSMSALWYTTYSHTMHLNHKICQSNCWHMRSCTTL